MFNRLIFDTESIETINDSHDVGAYIRSDESGALISHHGYTQDKAISFVFVDGDVNVVTDSIQEIGHGLNTGDKVQLTSTGTLPAGLSPATDYYVIRIDADNFSLASSPKNAEQGVAVDITDASSGGNHTVTIQEKDGRALDVYVVNPIDVTISPEGVHFEDDAHTSGDEGNFMLSIRIDDITADNSALLAGTNGDYQGTFTNIKGETYVKATDTDNLLTTIDSVLDNILLDTNAIVVDLAAIEAELLDQGLSLDTIAGDTTSIDATLTALSKAEDSVHVSGDQGIMSLAVRNDTLSSLVDADGDYAPFQVDADGALYVSVANEISVQDVALANVAIASAAVSLAAADTSQDLVASPLADRKYLFVANNDNRIMYLGGTGVTALNGFPLGTGSYLELRAGSAIDIEYVSSKLGHDARTLELS